MSLLSARNPWHCLSQVGYPDAPLYLKPPTLLLVQCLDAPANASRRAPFRSDLRSNPTSPTSVSQESQAMQRPLCG